MLQIRENQNSSFKTNAFLVSVSYTQPVGFAQLTSGSTIIDENRGEELSVIDTFSIKEALRSIRKKSPNVDYVGTLRHCSGQSVFMNTSGFWLSSYSMLAKHNPATP